VPLVEADTDAALAAMRSLPPEVDLVEVRLDLMDSFDLRRICAGKDRPIIVTNRPVRQGGRHEGPERERLATLRRAAELGADYVDVELDAAAELGELPAGTARIVSHHDFKTTPDDLEGVLRCIRATGPDVAKLVVSAGDIADVPPVLRLLESRAAQAPLVALSMGEAGMVSRVLAGKLGAFLTFASRGKGRESAPGQIPLEQMLGMYRFPQIGPGTALYGVVANPVAHSMSPAIHNAAFAARELDAVYLPFKVTDVRGFLEGFERYDLRGLSVTIPHKEAMLDLMDEVDEVAAEIGAVNTVHVRDGRRYGCNTDVQAAVDAIDAAVLEGGLGPLSHRRVLLVGAGGAARAIAHGLGRKGARLTIANRTVERAEKLAAEVGAEACGLPEMEGLRPDVLVNCTSVGMWPRVGESPVPAGMLREGMVVFDSVYNPVQTLLLREAEAAGALVSSGLAWFVNQAAAQFELWTGADAPRSVMEGEVRRRLAEATAEG
jgi:3-dehydroquinate dehydratase/shikimate dehydrogenase